MAVIRCQQSRVRYKGKPNRCYTLHSSDSTQLFGKVSYLDVCVQVFGKVSYLEVCVQVFGKVSSWMFVFRCLVS